MRRTTTRGASAERALRLGHRHRIVGDDRRAARGERRDDHARRRLAHVVGVGLEREAPQRERAAGEVGAEPRDDLVDQPQLLRVVDRLDGVEHLAAAGRARVAVCCSAFTSFGKHEPP